MKNKIVVDRKNLKNYKFKITVLSPTHIGTGEVYEPTNYIIDNKKLYAFDEVLFYKSLNELDRNKLYGKLGNYMEIIDFYKSQKEKAKEISSFTCSVSSRVEKKYNTQYNKDGSKNKNQLEIQTTFKNPNTHRAIIPGSSIKGMLETALKMYPKKISDNDKDKRQNIIISDALLLDGEVEIGYSDRRHRNPQKSSKDGINHMIEVIKPDSNFIFSIDSNLDFKELKQSMSNYHKKRDNSRYIETDNSFVARIGKNIGMDYVVDVEDVSKLKNKDQKPLATHFLYSSDTLSNEQFGWVKIEKISEVDYDKYIQDILDSEKKYYRTIELKQQTVKKKIETIKNETLKTKRDKEQEKLNEEKEELEKQRREKERLESLTPFEFKLDELVKKEPNMPKITVLLKAIKNNEFKDTKEALDYLITLMKKENLWVEVSRKKNPKKDKNYKRTLEVQDMLSNI